MENSIPESNDPDNSFSIDSIGNSSVHKYQVVVSELVSVFLLIHAILLVLYYNAIFIVEHSIR